MITSHQKYTSPSNITLKVGETLCYPTYNGFEHKEAVITHIVSHINEDSYYFCMNNGDMIQDIIAISAKFNSMSETKQNAITDNWS